MTSVHTTLRVPEQELAEIDRLAEQHGRSRTRFLVDAALNRLGEHQSELDQRVQALEREVKRLAELAYG